MEFSNPQTILENLVIGQGSIVVDLGTGSGHYSMAAARMVGSEGRVYAVDIQKDLLERLQHSATGEGHHNIEIIWGDVEKYGGTKLRENTADVLLLCNILFQLQDKRSAVTEAMRVLKPGGRLVAVDWTDSHFGMGPDQSLVVTEDTARSLLQNIGFQEEKTFEAGPHHWGVVFRKP